MSTSIKARDQYKEILAKADCLFDMAAINQGLDKLAEEITIKLQDKNPIILCVMLGALIPMGHLLSRLDFPLEIDYVHATRYQGEIAAKEIVWLREPRVSLQNRTVLLMDDIMDGGLTLAAIIDYCKKQGATDIQTAVMVNKKRTREQGVDFEPDFYGVEAEDRFLIGFGLDYNEYLRNAPGIYAVAEEHQ